MKDCNGECKCKDHPDDLTRLEVLTDLVEFAEKQLKKGSPWVMGWSNLEKWKSDIIILRDKLPNCTLEEFDDFRKRKRDFIKQIN